MKVNNAKAVSAFAVYKKVEHKIDGRVSKKKKHSKRKGDKQKSKPKMKLPVVDKKQNKNANGIAKHLKIKKEGHSKKMDTSNCGRSKKSAKKKNLLRPEPPKKIPKKSEQIEKDTNSLEHSSEEDDEEPPQLVEMICELTGETGDESKTSETNSLEQAKELFQWLLSPYDIDNFFTEFWEKKPLVVGRHERNYYQHIMSSETLDSILREHSLFYTRNIDIVSYESGVRETHNPEGRAVASAVWDYYQNGCSVRILNPQTYIDRVHLLLATLQEYFGAMVGANVYLTPAGSQGFAPHWDDIEAFVIQLEGRKHWKLYAHKDPKNILARHSSHNLERSELGELTHAITLDQGQLLYFPRGTIHEACADNETHSLHLTVSVYQNTCYADLLERALPETLKRAVARDIEFRKALPVGFLSYTGKAVTKQPEMKQKLVATVKSLMTKMVNYLEIDGAADQLGRKFMYDSLPPVLTPEEVRLSVKGDGERLAKGKVVNRIEFQPNTKIRLLRYYALRLVIEDSTPKIYYNTENSRVYHEEEEQFLEIDMALVPAVCHIINSFPEFVAVEELPINDDDMKIQVVADLWERGLLVTKERLEGPDSDGEEDDDDVEEAGSSSQSTVPI